jgi:pimeloyl-ACP methyl ester carboxylesterase
MTDDKSVTSERKRLAVQLESGFAELSYVVHAPPGARRTVICIHDFFGNSADFTRLAAMLAGHGIRLICPDMFGRGESAYLQPAQYNPHSYLLGLLALLGTLGTQRVSIIGKGWGALLALGVAGLPEANVVRLVLADLQFPWRLTVDDTIAGAVRGAALPTLEAARQLVVAGSEFAGVQPSRMLSLIDGRLRQVDGGYRLDFDPALLSEEALARFSQIATDPLFSDIKARILYMTASALGDRERHHLRGVGIPSPTRSFAESVGLSERIHFTGAHELLLTLGFLTSRFLPAV